MIKKFQIWLWGLVAELEYILYPWKTSTPPQWAIDRYSLDHGIKDEYEDNMYFGWMKAHEDKIGSIQLQLIELRKRINELENKN